ncbi:hypothetical protein M569_07408, partial [Genlisea aurea]
SPEPKRSKPRDNSGVGEDPPLSEESPELKNRRIQRELMAAAAEKRIAAAAKDASTLTPPRNTGRGMAEVGIGSSKAVDDTGKSVVENSTAGVSCALSGSEADKLFMMIFGRGVSKDILAQWCNQGIRFSDDPGTSMGLVQHEGGPCGVLAAIQAFVLKHLLFSTEETRVHETRTRRHLRDGSDVLSSLSEGKRSSALVTSMTEILFLCGRNERAVIASLNISGPLKGPPDDSVRSSFEILCIESGSDMVTALAVDTFASKFDALRKIEALIPVYRSRFGALLFLISALLSRGLDNVQDDRDDPSQPLVTAPFGHASQEIVNLLLSGSAVANVFDEKIDLGGGMFVKGVTTSVEVGFLTLLESLNFCKVGQYLKCPKWPIWVVGSESHYTVLFALDPSVQAENELEVRESLIRRAFDAEDSSGGGGFVTAEAFRSVIARAGISFPARTAEQLCGTGYVVWREFWQAVTGLDRSCGGVKDSTGMMGKKSFDLYHFNGIAKATAADPNGRQQRPRLIKLRVSVPPKWTPEEFMAGEAASSTTTAAAAPTADDDAAKPQHAPLVDCIRTRWPRCVCNWDGDAPSIV